MSNLPLSLTQRGFQPVSFAQTFQMSPVLRVIAGVIAGINAGDNSRPLLCLRFSDRIIAGINAGNNLSPVLPPVIAGDN